MSRGGASTRAIDARRHVARTFVAPRVRRSIALAAQCRLARNVAPPVPAVATFRRRLIRGHQARACRDPTPRLLRATITRAGARKTIERLFMQDRAFAKPYNQRTRSFRAQPKRRGGRIWTKRPNKLHPELQRGATATIKATPQHMKDLESVSDFVEVK